MTWRITYTDAYRKRAARFAKKYPELLPQYEKVLKILEANPFHPSLRLHQLQGKLKDLHSVSINLTYRMAIEFYMTGKEIVPVNIGHHREVY